MDDLKRISRRIPAAIDEKSGIPEFMSCQVQISHLQTLADTLDELEQARRKRGWFASSTSAGHSQLSQHMAAIIIFLNHLNSVLSKRFEAMKGAVRSRSVVQEKRITSLAAIRKDSKPTSPNTSPTTAAAHLMDVGEFAEQYGLSQDQIQMLQEEKQALFQELSQTKQQVSQAEKSVSEIVRLQITLQETLMYQETQIERLYDDSEVTLDMIQRGNVFLNKASKSQHTFRNIIVTIILIATFILWFMHSYN